MGDIRLNKLCKAYNVGLQDMMTALKQLGAVVPKNPNAKIPDKYIPLLDKRFGYSSLEMDTKLKMSVIGSTPLNGGCYIVKFDGQQYQVKKYPFQKDNIKEVSCYYTGRDANGEAQFQQDYKEVLMGLYREGNDYPFTLFGEGVDQNTGAWYYVLKDGYGLFHRVYSQHNTSLKTGAEVQAKVLSIGDHFLTLEILPSADSLASKGIRDVKSSPESVDLSRTTATSIDFSSLDPEKDSTLRDYQTDKKRKIYEAWRTCRSVMLQMPTGTGKTRLFVSIARDLFNYGVNRKKAVKILFLAHRKELIEQISDHLGRKYNLAHGLIMSQSLEQKKFPMQIGSVPTLTRRLKRWDDKDFDVIIIDEAHHVKAKSYKKIIDLYPNAKILGVTATPYRLNGAGFRPEFDELIVSPSVAEFIKSGYLSEYEYYSIKPNSLLQKAIDHMKLDFEGDYKESEMMGVMDRDHIRAGILATYQKFASGKKGIVYTISKDHNTHLAAAFNKVGIVSAAIDSDTPKEKRDDMVQKFKRGEIQVLFNVNIFSEGFDCPDVEVIQLARPTKSLAMYLQQVGRGLRPHDSKERLIILDNVGLFNKFGFPSARRKWRYHFEGRPVDESPASYIPDSDENREVRPIYEGDEDVEMLHDSRTEDVGQTSLVSIEHDYSRQFLEYASSHVSEHTANNYAREIRTRLDEFIRTYMDPTFKSIFNIISYDSLMSIYNDLRGSKKFVAFNKEKHSVFTAAFKRYIEFADWYSRRHYDEVPITPEDHEQNDSRINNQLFNNSGVSSSDDEIEREIMSLKQAIEFSRSHNFPVPKEMTEELRRLTEFRNNRHFASVVKEDIETELRKKKYNLDLIHSFTYDLAKRRLVVESEFPYKDDVRDESDLMKLITLMDRFNLKVPPEIKTRQSRMKQSKKIYDTVKALETALGRYIKSKRNVDILIKELVYSKDNGVSVNVGISALKTSRSKRSSINGRRASQQIKVTFRDGEVISRSTAKDTYIDVLERIGPNNIKDFDRNINGRPFFDLIPHPKYPGQSFKLSNNTWVNTNITTEKKVAIINEISQKYDLGIKAELV